jgi:hypothetical protein
VRWNVILSILADISNETLIQLVVFYLYKF